MLSDPSGNSRVVSLNQGHSTKKQKPVADVKRPGRQIM